MLTALFRDDGADDAMSGGADTAHPIHVWKRCHACDAAPIAGPRFECQTCPDGPDNDLCQRCFKAYERGEIKHPSPGSFAEMSQSSSSGPHSFLRVVGSSWSGFLEWAKVSDSPGVPPPVQRGFVVRPYFRTARESHLGSYAFVVDGPPLRLLTCLHVLGGLIQRAGIDASASNSAYSGNELPAIVTSVVMYDVYASNWMTAPLGHASRMLSLSNARIKEVEPFSQRDVAAFVVDGAAQVCPARLCERLPGVGEPVWLVVKRDRGLKERTIAATVVEATARTFIYRYFDDIQCVPKFASGAPIVNRLGEVVGMNAGFGTLEGKRFGHAVHVLSIRHHLDGVD
jgi:hypothetical protein